MSGADRRAGIALALQVAPFRRRCWLPRPATERVCTWRNLLLRLAIIAALRWCRFTRRRARPGAVAAAASLRPRHHRRDLYRADQESPVAGYCIALMIGAVSYTAVFAPQEIGSTALTLAGRFAIGLTVATAVAASRLAPTTRRALSRRCAAVLARARCRARCVAAARRSRSRVVQSSRIPATDDRDDDRRRRADRRDAPDGCRAARAARAAAQLWSARSRPARARARLRRADHRRRTHRPLRRPGRPPRRPGAPPAAIASCWTASWRRCSTPSTWRSVVSPRRGAPDAASSPPMPHRPRVPAVARLRRAARGIAQPAASAAPCRAACRGRRSKNRPT